MYCNRLWTNTLGQFGSCERFSPCIGLRAARPTLDLSFMRSIRFALLPLALACASSALAETLELGEVQVRSQESSELDLARARMNEVPGASNVIDLNTVETGRTSSNTDVLAYQPGVYAQSSGNDGAKVSVRGSGLNRAPGAHGSGLYVMFDGLPLTGPGGTPYELFEPLWLSRAEVLRGANGFDTGALALGGSINYVTRTGYDATPLQVRYETGSYGYQWSLAQLVEQLAFNQLVVGSNPTRPTIFETS